MAASTSEIKGVVENIVQGKKCPIVRINGEGYFCWDAPLRKDITDGIVKPGVELSLTFIPGQWPKAVSWKVTGQQQLGNGLASGPSKESASIAPGATSAGSEAIFRCTALKAAIEYMGSIPETKLPNAHVALVLSMADDFLKWLEK